TAFAPTAGPSRSLEGFRTRILTHAPCQVDRFKQAAGGRWRKLSRSRRFFRGRRLASADGPARRACGTAAVPRPPRSLRDRRAPDGGDREAAVRTLQGPPGDCPKPIRATDRSEERRVGKACRGGEG